MDAFSEVLAAVKLEGAMFFHAEFSAPWGFASPCSAQMAPELLPGAEHLILYHMLLDGAAVAHVEGGEAIAMCAGDIVIFPHGDAHRMGDRTPVKVSTGLPILERIRARNMGPLQAGGGGEVTRFVCGYMGCDPQLSQPILSGLPPIFKVNIRAGDSGRWLENSILHLVGEAGSRQPGSSAMLAKLSEALFVETLRQYVASLPEETTGWLAGTRDPVVGRSLAILHRRVSHPWTIVELAREVGMSRSALLERFHRYLAEPPMSYLTRWRLQLAARSLAATSRSVAQIAAEVGYESEAAFNRAFKRQFNAPPARYRRERREAAHAGGNGSASASSASAPKGYATR
jgi:AraC-like DNA-binding protein